MGGREELEKNIVVGGTSPTTTIEMDRLIVWLLRWFLNAHSSWSATTIRVRGLELPDLWTSLSSQLIFPLDTMNCRKISLFQFQGLSTWNILHTSSKGFQINNNNHSWFILWTVETTISISPCPPLHCDEILRFNLSFEIIFEIPRLASVGSLLVLMIAKVRALFLAHHEITNRQAGPESNTSDGLGDCAHILSASDRMQRLGELVKVCGKWVWRSLTQSIAQFAVRKRWTPCVGQFFPSSASCAAALS